MTESPASRVREANEVILVNGDLGAIPRFFAPDYIVPITEGLEAVRQIVGRLRRAFPDLTVEVEVLVEGSDRVAWQRTLRATHTGAHMGFPATGKTLMWRDMVTSRFQGGAIVEDWVITDLAEQLLRARKP